MDQQGREARAQIARAHAVGAVVISSWQVCNRGRRAERALAPVVPVVVGPRLHLAAPHGQD